MLKKKKIYFIFFFCLFLFLVFVYLKFFYIKDIELNENFEDKAPYSSNVIKEVKYASKDLNGNEYLIKALKGEIDIKDTNIIYLTSVTALIKLKDSDDIKITWKFGKYNLENFDTIFSKNVIISYMENIITSEYLDASPKRNTMIISRNVIYKNPKHILKADVIEINIKTKDTKISMYQDNKKVNIKSRDWCGNYKEI